MFTEQGEGNQRENIRREQMSQTEKQHRVPQMAADTIKEEEITEVRRTGQRKKRRNDQTWKTVFHKETKIMRDFNRRGVKKTWDYSFRPIYLSNYNLEMVNLENV